RLMRRRALSFVAFATVSLLLTFFIAAQIAHIHVGAKRIALAATFDDAMNLRAGDPVRLAGVPVGQVKGVRAIHGRARVRFDVDRSVPIPDDSQVAVRWLNLIGQRELYLSPGESVHHFRG